MGNKAKTRNTGETPVRTIRVPDRAWKRWQMAADISGIDRSSFIKTVVNNAAHQILQAANAEDGDDG